MLLIVTFVTYVLYAFIILVLIRVAFSWISPYPKNAVHRFAIQLTEPVMAPVRRWLPPMSGLDLTPMVVTIVAYFLIAALGNLR